ncbi:hypothetical protein P691DRAFT_837753 [Macrolepiota fuliginosa MF-IS2]|uniref:Uncharacterized protein n=1 Tax=Macrolepiota fuliginosa MF-IS2 TaxID=1400762 RepID=A0A9P5X6K7_9AGAR|nr:hypothetical protein P691DRAFT_837753 [Macrolepiota fuliginosa MF-IS2]
MLIALLLVLAALRPSSSIPVDGHFNTFLELAGQPSTSPTRTPQNIIWSCLATIFACVWVAVHPNIPNPRESQWRQFWRRVSTMLYAVIAPELVTLWAIRQRSAAGRIKRDFNDRYFPNGGTGRWTLSHGFFIQMGGLLFAQEGRDAYVITYKELLELIDNGNIDFPSITEEDILDKSKGDFLTKILVVIQTTWFIVQCLVRWAFGLAVTEIEVVTLAFAILNIVTYIMWFPKPLNVQVGIKIPKSRDAPLLPVPKPEVRKGWLQRQIERGNKGGRVTWVPWMVLVSLLLPSKLFSGLFLPLGAMATDDQVLAGSAYVPTFYADLDITTEIGVICPSLGMSVVFGALHFIPWNLEFPSDTEELLWRICSVVITVEPLPAAIGLGLSRLTKGYAVGDVITRVMESMATSIGSLAFIGLPLYVLARLTLLILAFTTLRSLRGTALTDVAWSSFVPHI